MSDIIMKAEVYQEVVKILGSLPALDVGHLLTVTLNNKNQKIASLVGCKPVLAEAAKPEAKDEQDSNEQ